MSKSLKMMPTTYRRGDLKIVISRIVDTSSSDPVACELQVMRKTTGYSQVFHETHVWLDDIRQLLTLRDAINSFIDEHHLDEFEEGGEL